MTPKMSEVVPFLTVGEHEVLALALRISDDEVILPADNTASRDDVHGLHEAGWLDFRDDTPEGGSLIGFQASAKLRAAPWAQALRDNPFPD
jgi:hypothetical protein